MSTDGWRRLERIFEAAMQRPAAARAAFVAQTCGSDRQLATEASTLLAAAERCGDFLEAPALDRFAREVAREGWSVQPGERIGSYVVDRRLGSGGMGEVFRARDERLGRDVAIKLLLPHARNGAERLRALDREARAAGSLNHVNVVTVHDVGEHRGTPYLVTEYLEGEPLRARLAGGALSFNLALDIALQMARGLAAAHERGIVHRDLKPENVFLTRDGRAKILDFGLAKRADGSGEALVELSQPRDAARSSLAGTVGYMAPEQMRGEPVDRRADVFALGVILHEMLTGRRPLSPWDGLGAPNATMSLDLALPNVPERAGAILRRCLASSPEDRFGAAGQLVTALEALVAARVLPPPQRPLAALARRPMLWLGAVALVLGLLALGHRWRSHARALWARSEAAPEVQRLLDRGEVTPAFLLARRALDVTPGEPLLARLWQEVSTVARITTEPPGADVRIGAYEATPTSWLSLGQTPLRDVRVPRGSFRLEITKAGFSTIEGMGTPVPELRYRLEPAGTTPANMVRVVGGPAPARFGLVADLGDYFIDKYEVSNRKFKEFVDQGGYVRRELWTEPFTLGERTLSWDEASARFVDSTGQPGPATWKAGTYREGEADFPVTGVSWFEAAAYATYAGKSLPTLYHWYHAASLGRFIEMLNASNFAGIGLARGGRYHGLGPFGTYDMAGNAREWAYNEMDGGRFVLGGAWDDSTRMFANSDAKSPFERSPNLGFRLAQHDQPPPALVSAPIRLGQPRRDARALAPVDDPIFEVFRRQFAYDRAPLNVDSEPTTEAESWRQESISLDAAYAGERLRAHVFLPKGTPPPYQPVIFFPPSDVFILRSSRELALAWGEPIVKSGRALIYPVYKGTYERQGAVGKGGTNEARELRIAWSRDLGRIIDYLETRADMDRDRLTFYAVRASSHAVVLTALEPRVRYAVLQGAGIWIWNDVAPEIDAINYAPRVRVPVLMLGVRYDFDHPVEPAQRPLFDLLGTPAEHKQHTILEMGHGIPVPVSAQVILPWLDRYVGPAR